MCTFLIYFDPKSPQPLTMASTRDEALDRKTEFPSKVNWHQSNTYYKFLDKPGNRLHLNFLREIPPPEDVPTHIARRYTASRPERYRDYTEAGIQGPQDKNVDGMFAGINKYGMVVAINNLEVNLDVKNKLARSGLGLDALTFESADKAAHSIYQKLQQIQSEGLSLNGERYFYPACNLIIADAHDAYILQCGSKSVLPKNVDSEFAGGKIAYRRYGNDGHARLIGDITGQHRVVALERIPPRTPTIICGWCQNDDRSMRSQHFLEEFSQLCKNLPQAHDPKSWKTWLEFMQERTRGQGSAYSQSIAQPPYDIFDKVDSEKMIKWGTINTSLFTINQYDRQQPVARMLYSPSPPSVEHPMEFQRIKSPNRFFDTLPEPVNISFSFNSTASGAESQVNITSLKRLPIRHVPELGSETTISSIVRMGPKNLDKPAIGNDYLPNFG